MSQNLNSLKYLKTLTILCLLVFSTSCNIFQKDEYYFLSSSRRSLLKTGDTLVYVDNNSKEDTFLVFKKITPNFKISLTGSSCKSNPAAYFDVEFIYFIKNGEVVQFCDPQDDITYGDCEASYSCKETILICVWATDPDRDLRNSLRPWLSCYGDGYRLDSIVYDMSVFDVTYDTAFHFSAIKSTGLDYKEIYYTYKYGIIQMNEFNGNVLRLIR
jgi:hypothetical protein